MPVFAADHYADIACALVADEFSGGVLRDIEGHVAGADVYIAFLVKLGKLEPCIACGDIGAAAAGKSVNVCAACAYIDFVVPRRHVFSNE